MVSHTVPSAAEHSAHLELTADEAAVAARLLSRLLSLPHDISTPGIDYYELACALYEGRRERRHFFPSDLFADPAWDMLLLLYCAGGRGERPSVSSVCHASEVPITTGHRWLRHLEDRGLILRAPHSTDRRSFVLGLTEEGKRKMNGYLHRLFERRIGPIFAELATTNP